MTSLILWFALGAHAQVSMIQTECTPGERQVLANDKFRSQMAPGRLVYSDCAALPGDRLMILATMNPPSGSVTRLAIFKRTGFNIRSRAEMRLKIPALDMFPMRVSGAQRLLFVMPGANQERVDVWINPQTGPDTTKFGMLTIDLVKKKASMAKRSYLLPAGRFPALQSGTGRWKATLDGKQVPL